MCERWLSIQSERDRHWLDFSGNSGIQANGSAWGAAPAPAGKQTAFIQTTGTVRQTLNLNAGSHTLSFQAAQGSPHAQPIKVTMDGIRIGSLVSPTSTSFTAFTIPFSVATSGARTLAFTGTDPANKTTFIDAVTLSRAFVAPYTMATHAYMSEGLTWTRRRATKCLVCTSSDLSRATRTCACWSRATATTSERLTRD